MGEISQNRYGYDMITTFICHSTLIFVKSDMMCNSLSLSNDNSRLVSASNDLMQCSQQFLLAVPWLCHWYTHTTRLLNFGCEVAKNKEKQQKKTETELLTTSIDGKMTNYDIKFQRQTTRSVWNAVNRGLEGIHIRSKRTLDIVGNSNITMGMCRRWHFI